MKITKFVHSCLLVEMPDRTVLFDPGMMSQAALDIDKLVYLDDILITHSHGDHVSVPLVQDLVTKFPTVRITAPADVVEQLKTAGIKATSELPDNVMSFAAPHESVDPIFPTPEQLPYHYAGHLTHPGDSHSFTETQAILALPVTAPWGSMIRAANLALELQPKHVLPIHDWHWSNAARESSYNTLEQFFGEHSITFHKLQTGKPVNIAI